MFPSAPELENHENLLEWAEAVTLSSLGPGWNLKRWEPLGGRVNRIWRLDYGSSTDTRSFFLKQLPSRWQGTRLQQHFAQLAVLSAVPFTGPLMGPRILAVSEFHGAYLTERIVGRRLDLLHGLQLVQGKAAQEQLNRTWERIGAWLGVLHSETSHQGKQYHLAALRGYVVERLRLWRQLDMRADSLATLAERAVTIVSDGWPRPFHVTLCHGDVTAGNIIVTQTHVGLIDFDDITISSPASDLVQAWLEIRQLSSALKLVPNPHRRSMLWDAFIAGYGGRLPPSAELWLLMVKTLSERVLAYRQTHPTGTAGNPLSRLRYRRLCTDLYTLSSRPGTWP